MNLKITKLSEKSQTQKVCMVRLPSRGILKKAELNSSDRKMLGAWGPGNILGMRMFGGDDGNILYLDCCVIT